jgi:hypothetical protein
VSGDEAVVAALTALEHAAVPYMIVGSLASNFYGVPRATRDADLVVDVAGNALARLQSHLPSALTLQPQPAFEAITGTTRHLVAVAGTPFVIEVFGLSDDAHDQARFTRRRRVVLLGQSVSIATAEDMVITKLRWARDGGRSKDFDDVRNILAVQGAALDGAYLAHWTAQHETAALLDRIRALLPRT